MMLVDDLLSVNVFHTHFPARGRKRLVNNSLVSNIIVFHTHFPARGRKQVQAIMLEIRLCKVFHTHFPARGRKRWLQNSKFTRMRSFSYPFPRKGTETSPRGGVEGCSIYCFSYPFPRKGTETLRQLLHGSWQPRRLFFIPISPQGDGNNYTRQPRLFACPHS